MSRGYSMMCLVKKLTRDGMSEKQKSEILSKHVSSVRKATLVTKTANTGLPAFNDLVITEFMGFASFGVLGSNVNAIYAMNGKILNESGKNEFGTTFCGLNEEVTFTSDGWEQTYCPKNMSEILVMMNEVSFKLALEKADED